MKEVVGAGRWLAPTGRGLERREGRRDALGDGLVEPNRPDDVAQPVHSQVEQRDLWCQLLGERDRRVRDDDLPAASESHDPGRLVQGHAEQLVAHLGDLAGVNRHPDPDGCVAWPRLGRQGALGLDGRATASPADPKMKMQPSHPWDIRCLCAPARRP